MQRIKEGYLIWIAIVPHIAKGARYTIGARIENKFLDLLELAYIAYFTEKNTKSAKIDECILHLDALKFLVSIAWEGKLISNTQCENVAQKLEEVGKIVSETEHELIVRIPRIVGFRPIVVQPQTIVVAFEVEDVRVAVGIGSCSSSSVPPSV